MTSAADQDRGREQVSRAPDQPPDGTGAERPHRNGEGDPGKQLTGKGRGAVQCSDMQWDADGKHTEREPRQGRDRIEPAPGDRRWTAGHLGGAVPERLGDARGGMQRRR